MIKNEPQKKTKVCNSCITLMSEADYAEHDGKCQLCRNNGAVNPLNLFHISYYNGDETETEHRVYQTQDPSTAESNFEQEYRREHDYEPEWTNAYRITRVGGYMVKLIPAEEDTQGADF